MTTVCDRCGEKTNDGIMILIQEEGGMDPPKIAVLCFECFWEMVEPMVSRRRENDGSRVN
jgi:hypothetical protein